jgi:hypothetical protein
MAKDSQELLFKVFGYEHSNFHNNVQLSALFDIKKCREEWPGFKMIIVNNFSPNDIEVILPLLIQDYNDVFPFRILLNY